MNISRQIREQIRDQLKIRVQWLRNNPCYLWAAEKNRVRTPKGVMVHSTGANNPRLSRYVAPDDGEMGPPSPYHWNQPMDGNPKGVHAFIGKLADGSVAVRQTLPWTYEGWHCGGKANATHIGFEICEDSLDPEKTECWLYFAKAYRQAALLTAHLCARYGLDPREDGVVLCHCEGHRRGWATNHGDVLHWWPRFGRNMDDFRADVWALLEGRDIVPVEIPQHLRPKPPKKPENKEDEEMTDEKFEQLMARYLFRRADRKATMPALLARAVEMGITDGTRPMAAATRQEAAIMARKAQANLEEQLPELIRQELGRMQEAEKSDGEETGEEEM